MLPKEATTSSGQQQQQQKPRRCVAWISIVLFLSCTFLAIETWIILPRYNSNNSVSELTTTVRTTTAKTSMLSSSSRNMLSSATSNNNNNNNKDEGEDEIRRRQCNNDDDNNVYSDVVVYHDDKVISKYDYDDENKNNIPSGTATVRLVWKADDHQHVLQIREHNDDNDDSCTATANGTTNGTTTIKIPNTSIPYKTLGPNEYLVQLDGKELHAAVPTYHNIGNNCGTYEVTWPDISSSGIYRLLIRKLRSNYSAIREDIPKFPIFDNITSNHIVDVLIEINNTSCGCHHHSKKKGKGIWTAMTENYGKNQQNNATTELVGMPKQRRIDWTKYKFIKKKNYCDNNNNNNNKEALGALLDPQLHNWKNVSILFLGDSHTRTAYEDLIPYLKLGPRNPHTKFDQPKICTRFLKETGKQWCSQPEKYGNLKKYRDEFSKWDIVVFNFGQHHASANKATFTQYSKDVDNAINEIRLQQTLGNTHKTKFVWLSIPPLVRDDKWIREYKDWDPRTTF